MKKEPKLKASKNKAETVETNPELQKLLAQIGSLSRQRDKIGLGIRQAEQVFNQLTAQMRELDAKIEKIENG